MNPCLRRTVLPAYTQPRNHFCQALAREAESGGGVGPVPSGPRERGADEPLFEPAARLGQGNLLFVSVQSCPGDRRRQP